jgi:hypothetical protein
MNSMTGGGGGRRGRDLRPPRKVVRLHPGGPWVWDEGGDPPASPRRGWWALWGLTPVPFFGVHSRDEGREVEKAS